MNIKNSVLGLVALVAGACATQKGVERDISGWEPGVRVEGNQYVSVACMKGRNISMLYPAANGRARIALVRALEGKNDVDKTISHEPAEYEEVNGALCARIRAYRFPKCE